MVTRTRSIYNNRIGWILGALVLLGAVIKPADVRFQTTDGNWSEPVNLSNSDVLSAFPWMTADPSGVVHLVWIEELNPSENVILYSRLENAVWTSLVDIIVDARGETVIASCSISLCEALSGCATK